MWGYIAEKILHVNQIYIKNKRYTSSNMLPLWIQYVMKTIIFQTLYPVNCFTSTIDLKHHVNVNNIYQIINIQQNIFRLDR
jgi:hypothetical protein